MVPASAGPARVAPVAVPMAVVAAGRARRLAGSPPARAAALTVGLVGTSIIQAASVIWTARIARAARISDVVRVSQLARII